MKDRIKIHTTNYIDTFIEAAEDAKGEHGTKPPTKNKKTVAAMQYDLIASHPYKYTSDDIFFQVFADRNDLSREDYKEERVKFFSKGQACFRSSPLTKTYNFGVHSNRDGKVAIYGKETADYQQFLKNPAVKKIKAMRTAKVKT